MQSIQLDRSPACAAALSAGDPLKDYRERFFIPKADGGSECVYLSGHSLGLQPRTAHDYIRHELEDWQRFGVEGHFRAMNPWVSYHKLLTEQTARLIGAEPVEVVVMNSLTVNLHLMMVSFYRPSAQRHKILIEGGAFPSDQYAVKSQIRFHGFDPASSLLELKPRPGESWLREEDILQTIEEEGNTIALVLLGGVNYATGQAFDIASIAKAGHAKGCMVGSDLAHAVGNLELKLHDSGVDFAVWCSYKYLNGGPGCVGGCFVHQRHARDFTLPRFAGWWGHNEQQRFLMAPEFDPLVGAEGWQLSNAPVFSMAGLRASMNIFDEVGMARLRSKSVELTHYLEFLLLPYAGEKFRVITPAEPLSRGAQLSVRLLRDGRSVCERLIHQGIICDWREPDVLRIAPVPLYNTFSDVFRFVEVFAGLLT
ncbi:MAG: kynureninase [Acidobacteriaceae bacterium]